MRTSGASIDARFRQIRSWGVALCLVDGVAVDSSGRRQARLPSGRHGVPSRPSIRTTTEARRATPERRSPAVRGEADGRDALLMRTHDDAARNCRSGAGGRRSAAGTVRLLVGSPAGSRASRSVRRSSMRRALCGGSVAAVLMTACGSDRAGGRVVATTSEVSVESTTTAVATPPATTLKEVSTTFVTASSVAPAATRTESNVAVTQDGMEVSVAAPAAVVTGSRCPSPSPFGTRSR